MADRRAVARSLVSQRIVRVDYLDIDYRGWDLGHHDQSSRRRICSETEWADPTWDGGTFHHLDFGIELITDRGETWCVTWDSPNPVTGESLRLQRDPGCLRGAVWDVTTCEPWNSYLASPISDVVLHYHPWSGGTDGFWCSRVSLHFAESRIEILLGDRDQSGSLTPSADNIAVLLDADALPSWEPVDDLV